MKPTISLYHVSGLLPAQYRNDPKEARRHIEPGIYRVRSIAIDKLRCNISITNGVGWLYITDGYLYLPAKDSKGA